MNQRKRENWIDCLKCAAILIVVMNHAGVTVPGVNFWGGMFFVPVFFVLSGYTCQIRDESLRRAGGRRAKRLLVPYFTANMFLLFFFFVKDVLITGSKTVVQEFGALFGVFYGRNQIFSLDHNTLFHVPVQENYYLMQNLNSPTWFLPALFLTLLLYETAARVMRQDERKEWLLACILLLVGVVYHYICPFLLMWSIDAVPFFFLLFMIGNVIKKYDLLEWADRHKWAPLLTLAALIPCALFNGSTNFSIGQYGKSVILALVNAALSSVLMMYLLWKIRNYIPGIFTIVGRHTLFILCYHMLVLAILETAFAMLPAPAAVLVTVAVLTAAAATWDVVRQKYRERRGRNAER